MAFVLAIPPAVYVGLICMEKYEHTNHRDPFKHHVECGICYNECLLLEKKAMEEIKKQKDWARSGPKNKIRVYWTVEVESQKILNHHH